MRLISVNNQRTFSQHMPKVLFLFIFFLVSSQQLPAQSHILKGDTGMPSPEARLADVAWIQGYWQGEAFGGMAEEVWLPPMGESMMFAYKLVVDGKVAFYEVGYIKEKDNSLLLQLKHFDPDLKGWEEKEETVDFPLLRIEPNKAYFDGITFERSKPGEMMVYLLLEDREGVREVPFTYRLIE